MMNPLQFVEGYARGTLSEDELALLNQFPNTKAAAILRKKEIDSEKTTYRKTIKKGRK